MRDWARLIVLLSAAAGGLSAASFGTTYPRLGEFSDLALDEARSVLYLSNFTGGRIEVFSTVSLTWQAPIRLGINPSALALSPDNRLLLILNFGSPSMFVVDLDSRAVQTIAVPAVPGPRSNLPRAAAFASDGSAIILTTFQVMRYDPSTGVFTVLRELGALLGDLPVPAPRFPAEIVNARMAASRDRNTIFMVGSFAQDLHFVFYYSLPDQRFQTRQCFTLLREPLRFASLAPDGSRLMGGHLLLDRELRILADFVPSGQLPIQVAPPVPTAPPPNAPPPQPTQVIGASEFSRDGGTIYASLVERQERAVPPVMYVLDSDNLTIRERLLLPDRLTGKMVSDSPGNRLYAVSDSGLTIVPVGELAEAPRISPAPDTVVFRFNACNRQTATATFDLVHRGNRSANFTVSSQMPGLTLSPSSGATPARITATFDPERLFNVRGTSPGLINIASDNAVNLPAPVRVLANLQDTDQRGTIFVQNGQMRDILIDEVRQRFYLVESHGNRLLVYDLNDFSLLRTVRTGHFPMQMAITPDGRTLLVVNAQSETISMINLDSLESQGFIYCPCSTYPRSIAVSTNATLITTAVDRGVLLRTADNQQVQVVVTQGELARVSLATRSAAPLGAIGIFENRISPRTLLMASPSGSRILVAEDGGVARVYEAESDSFLVARSISGPNLRGSAALSDTGLYNAGPVMMGPSLMPLTQFQDDPEEHNGLIFLGTQIIRTTMPISGVGPGRVSRVDTATLRTLRPVKLAESPLGLFADQPLRRSLAGTSNGSRFITLSSSGFEVIPGNFDAFVPPATIRAIANSASFSEGTAPGALISIFGENLAQISTTAGALPLPTFLADTCLTVNHLPIPLLFLSPRQINAQMPFEVAGAATMVAHTPGGVSEPFPFNVQAAAPALFRSTFGGQSLEPLPIILRAYNQEPITLSNPVRRGEVLFMFGTGLGGVSPRLASGEAAPPGILFRNLQAPVVTIGGREAAVEFAGLAAGFVGLNQLNIRVPADAPLGFDIPLRIVSGGVTFETFLVRVMPELER